MRHQYGIGIVLMLGAALAGLSLSASGQTTQQIAHTDASGAWIERIVDPHGQGTGGTGGDPRAGILWHVFDTAAITLSVCVADTTNETWLGQNLNNERLSYLQTTGTGTPIYEFNLVPENPDTVVVASAEDVSLGALAVKTASGVSVRGFNAAGGPTPLWTYTFNATYNTIQTTSLDVSANGALVACAAYNGNTAMSRVVTLNGATGAVLHVRDFSANVTGIELSDDGARAALTRGDTTEIIETTGMTTLFTFSVSGSGGYSRLSRDGKVAVAGGFNYRAFKETGGVWSQVYNAAEANQWFGWGMAVSGDGKTMFVVSHNYATGYLVLTYRAIDLVGGVELARTTTTGTGSYQDAVQRAQASGNGQVLAVVSWGTQDNAHPEVQVFDRALHLIGSIDTPGSPFDLDLTRSGQFLVAGGKHVHANAFGNGGDAYAYEVAINHPGDMNCDGVVDFADIDPFVLALTSKEAYEAQYPNCNWLNGDCNGDGTVDFADIDPFVALLTG